MGTQNAPSINMLALALALALAQTSNLVNGSQYAPMSPPFPPHHHSLTTNPCPAQPTGQEQVLLRESVSVSTMHAQLLHNNKVVVFDRTDFGPSNLSLPANKCREKVGEVLKVHCTAPSLLYDISSNTSRALSVPIYVLCSSASGGRNPSPDRRLPWPRDWKIRVLFTPCDDAEECDWIELPQNLTFERWYASDQTLPNGRVIVIGGRDSPNYEFFPKLP